MDLLCILHISQHRVAWIKTDGLRSNYSKNRLNSAADEKQCGRGRQHPLLSLLRQCPCLSPSGHQFLSDASRAHEANIYTCLKFWLFFILFLNYRAIVPALHCTSPNSVLCNLPMLLFSNDKPAHSYCTRLLSFCSFFIPISFFSYLLTYQHFPSFSFLF